MLRWVPGSTCSVRFSYLQMCTHVYCNIAILYLLSRYCIPYIVKSNTQTQSLASSTTNGQQQTPIHGHGHASSGSSGSHPTRRSNTATPWRCHAATNTQKTTNPTKNPTDWTSRSWRCSVQHTHACMRPCMHAMLHTHTHPWTPRLF